MDRERLKEVHQTDLTESRVNEEFVDWMKTKGPTWLLVILVAVCAYLAVVRFRQHRIESRNEAWAAFLSAELPGSFEDVAREYGGVDQLGNLARLQAADQLLRSVQAGTALGAPVVPDPGVDPAPETELTEEERDRYLSRAERLYEEVIDADDRSDDAVLHVVGALNGQAAIAECRGDAEAAKSRYLAAAERAEGRYPGLARQARARADSVSSYLSPVAFRGQDDAAEAPTPVTPTPISIEESLRELLLPDEAEG